MKVSTFCSIDAAVAPLFCVPTDNASCEDVTGSFDDPKSHGEA